VGNTHLRSDLREHGEITASITNIQTTSLDVQTLQFDTSFVDGTVEGRLQWNSDDGTMEYGLPGGNVTLQVGQEQLVKVVNKTATDITNGQVVYFAGAQGSRPKIALADPTSRFKSVALGMATEDIDSNGQGYVNVGGLVRDIDTSNLAAGGLGFLSIATPGGLTPGPPDAPNWTTVAGYCVVSNSTSGVFFVRILSGPRMISLSDVDHTAPYNATDGQFLSWVASPSMDPSLGRGRWELAQEAHVGNAASYVRINKDKGVRLVGIEAWDDLRFPVNAVTKNFGTTKPDDVTLFGGFIVLGFDANASEGVTFTAQLPHAWLQGSDIEAHVHWTPTDDTAGGVRWQMDYSWANISSPFPALATVGVTSNAASDNVHLYADMGDMAGAGKTVSSMILCKLVRNVTHSEDTYSADAGLMEVDFHYRIDGFGSEEEDSKA
jgi:hypothetical protein